MSTRIPDDVSVPPSPENKHTDGLKSISAALHGPGCIFKYGNPKPYRCDYCNVNYKRCGNLLIHLKTEEHITTSNLKQWASQQPSLTPIASSIQLLKNNQSLSVEMNRNHNNDDGIPNIQILPVKPKLIPAEEFVRRILIEAEQLAKQPCQSLKTVAKPEIQPHVGVTKEPYGSNIRESHSSLNMTRCPWCNGNFDTPVDLQTHIHVDHDHVMKKEFRCSRVNCGKVFLREHYWRRHVKEHYLNDERVKSMYMLSKFQNNVFDPPLSGNDIRATNQNQYSTTVYKARVQPYVAKPFLCTYCSTWYRTQGVLSHHLKSKAHLTRLLTLGLLPSDFIISSKEKYNNYWLDQMDTTDCERALHSLLAIIEKLRLNGQCQNSFKHLSSFFIAGSPQTITTDGDSQIINIHLPDNENTQYPPHPSYHLYPMVVDKATGKYFHLVPKHIADFLRNDYRPFRCSYCDYGFMGEGYLARHYKSKIHIIVLFSIGKLPKDFDPYSPEIYDNGWLDEMDTSDCERALQSLLVIIEKLRLHNLYRSAMQQPLSSIVTETTQSNLNYAQISTAHSVPMINGTVDNADRNARATVFHSSISTHDPDIVANHETSSEVPKRKVKSSSNGQSFDCSYCSVHFRAHKRFAKHLKTKKHVTKLLTLGKLPSDILLYSTGKYDDYWLRDLDTTDCESSLQSLLAIIDTLRLEDQFRRAMNLPSPCMNDGSGHFKLGFAQTTLAKNDLIFNELVLRPPSLTHELQKSVIIPLVYQNNSMSEPIQHPTPGPSQKYLDGMEIQQINTGNNHQESMSATSCGRPFFEQPALCEKYMPLQISESVFLHPSSAEKESSNIGSTIPISRKPTKYELLSNSASEPLHCFDCLLRFGTRARLARHFKSKRHLTSLYRLGKLPADFDLPRKQNTRYNDYWLEDIDTTDCDTALKSIKEVIEKRRLNVQCQNTLPQPTSSLGSGSFHREIQCLQPSETNPEVIDIKKESIFIQHQFQNQTSTSSLSHEAKPFGCSFCGIGFMSQKILARHLKSKIHLAKLGSLSLLPKDIVLYSRGRYNDAWLDELETTDCESALISLLGIIGKLCEQIGNVEENVISNPETKVVYHYSYYPQRLMIGSFRINIDMTTHQNDEVFSEERRISNLPKAEHLIVKPVVHQNESMNKSIQHSIVTTPGPSAKYLPFNIVNILADVGVERQQLDSNKDSEESMSATPCKRPR